MNTSEARHRTVCDTTCIRAFAITGQFDLLVAAQGGSVLAPRQVFDPWEDPGGIRSLLSEVVRIERHFSRLTDPESMQCWSRLHALRQRSDIEVADLTDEEIVEFAQLTSRAFGRARGLAVPLGPGEAAVMAMAATRRWSAVIDDGAARRVLTEWAPGVPVMTARELLRDCALKGLVSSEEADAIYARMRDLSYLGPDSLWND